MSETADGPCAATDPKILERHITSHSIPKNEAEWWACHEIERLRAELAESYRIKLEANRLYRYLNGMDQDTWDKRAEWIMSTVLDGAHIGPTNREMVKALLADHFADIGDRLRAALERIIRHPDCKRLIAQIACEALEGKEG